MIEYFTQEIKKDASGYFYGRCRFWLYRINRTFYSIWMNLILYTRKIKIGKMTVFIGKSFFSRYPESVISIGNNCTFNSAKFSNPIGVNKCCMITTLRKDAEIHIGNEVGFSGVKIGCFKKIVIGNECLIGANVLITDSDWHPISPDKRKKFDPYIKSVPVKIGNNVFIGVNSIILKGTEIGDNSIIGAGSVVSGIIPSNVIATGNPCKVIKKIVE